MKKLSLLWLLPLLWLCTACPYESQVPISEAETPIPDFMLGKWTKDRASKDFYDIKKTETPNVMAVYENLYNKDESKFSVKKFAAHFSEHDGQTFLNVRLEKDANNDGMTTTDNYFLYRIDFDGDKKFVLHPLSEYIREQFDTPADLRAFISKHRKLSFFYSADVVYEKL